jgi:hypothetical protein
MMKDETDEATLVLIGDDEERSPHDLVGETAAATVIAIDQQLYAEGDEPWARGDHVGEAHGVAVTTHGGRVVCSFTFELGGEDSVAMHGVLPLDGGSIGSGRVAITGGTGRFRNASGSVGVEHRNPKRYRLMLS